MSSAQPVTADQPPRRCCAEFRELNWNARLTLIVSPMFMATMGLSDSPLAAFVLLLTTSNFEVGIASGVSGLALLFVAPCAGALADTVGRQIVLRIASVLVILSSGWICTWILYFQPRVSGQELYYFLLASQFINGLRRAFQGPALDAIFGDSVASGRRSKLYARRSSLNKVRDRGSNTCPLRCSRPVFDPPLE